MSDKNCEIFQRGILASMVKTKNTNTEDQENWNLTIDKTAFKPNFDEKANKHCLSLSAESCTSPSELIVELDKQKNKQHRAVARFTSKDIDDCKLETKQDNNPWTGHVNACMKTKEPPSRGQLESIAKRLRKQAMPKGIVVFNPLAQK